MKTLEERKVEIAALNEIKPNTRHKSAFGDDHHAAIDAQIEVLHECMSEDDIYAAWGDEDMDEFAQNVLDEAIMACNWMKGWSKDAPHLGWKDLAL